MALIRGGLRTRLALVTMLIAALAMVAVVVLVQVYLARVAESDSTRLARARAAAVVATIARENGELVVDNDGRGTDSLTRDVWVFGPGGRLLAGSLRPGLESGLTTLGSSATADSIVVGDGTRLVSRPVRDGTRLVAVVVAGVDLAPYEDAERRGLWVSLALALVAVLAAGAAASEAARHTLRQVQHMVRNAQDWEEHDLDRRFALGPPVDEITELGRTLDHMLDRIATAMHAERRLSDEVAHELRTPLTVIRAEAELALAGADGLQEQALAAIVEATERVDGVVGSMLDAARRRHDREATVDLVALLADLPSTAAPGVELVLPIPGAAPVLAAAPGPLVLSAVAPLVDNALRHASARVEVSVLRRAERVVIVVQDDGPGVPASESGHVFRPGHRGTTGGAAGLGLAVSRRLAESVGGEVRVHHGDGGRFEIDLPAAD